MIKDKFPDSIVCTDVALDPYSDQGASVLVSARACFGFFYLRHGSSSLSRALSLFFSLAHTHTRVL